MDGYKTISAFDTMSDDLQEFFEIEGWYELSKADQTDEKFEQICKKFQECNVTIIDIDLLTWLQKNYCDQAFQVGSIYFIPLDTNCEKCTKMNERQVRELKKYYKEAIK